MMGIKQLLNCVTLFSLNCLLVVGMTAEVDAQISANGQNVKWLSYTQPQGGSVTGKFYQNGNGQWIEEAADGQHTFTEKSRDAWSVYLRKSDGASVQLDLHTKDITLNGSRKLYKIASAQTSVPAAPVKGTNVKWVSYTGGTFRQTAPGKWAEDNSDGHHTFNEQNRDEWSVYLKRTDGALTIQLDLHTKDIVLNGNQKLYRITKASANPSGN